LLRRAQAGDEPVLCRQDFGVRRHPIDRRQHGYAIVRKTRVSRRRQLKPPGHVFPQLGPCHSEKANFEILGRPVDSDFGANEIKTFVVTGDGVRETDLLEW
jgi:hypothetical protein